MSDCQEKIKKIREMTGLSRKEFCDKFGIPYQTVTDWELGHRNAPDYVVRLLAYYVLMNTDPIDELYNFKASE